MPAQLLLYLPLDAANGRSCDGGIPALSAQSAASS